ncbi:MAG TPA: hypothetical protein VKE51_26275 [Vicinamibacterales bacterium]|nr:hypothetical protein [Vicinamibacterales bacterium]
MSGAIESGGGVVAGATSGFPPRSTRVMNVIKKAFRDRIGSQIDLAHAKLEALRARAEAASARAALAAIVALLSEKSAIDRKVDELRESSHTTYQQLRAELESRVAQLEASVQAIESKVKAA